MSDFELIADPKGLFLDVKYPENEKPRYTIDLMKLECTCKGYTIEQARAKKENRTPKICKHLDEVAFRIRNSGINFNKYLPKGVSFPND